MGKSTEFWNVPLFIGNRIILIGLRGRHQSCLNHVCLGCTQRECKLCQANGRMCPGFLKSPGFHEKWKLPLELPNPEGYRQPKRMSATPHVNRFVTVFSCRSHRGNLFGESNVPLKIWRNTVTQESPGFSKTLGRTTAPSETVWHLVKRFLPYLDEEILSRYEEDVSSTRSGFWLWVKTALRSLLGVTMSMRRVPIPFREAPATKHSILTGIYHFNNVSNRLTERRRLRICNWNPGSRRGSYRRTYCGEWHIITLQEGIEYFEEEFLANRFHVTHFGGCVILFNKDSFLS